jgi:hypothetical protein
MTAEPQHYLITLDLTPRWRLHGYLKCVDRGLVELAIRKMLDTAKSFGPLQCPFVLLTQLTSGRELVRAVACSRSAAIARRLAAPGDFHCVCWTMPAGGPDDARLMNLQLGAHP